MSVLDKVKWILGILMVFVIVIATNLIDRNNFLRVREAAVTIYEDRLVAKDLIYDLSKAIQEKELATATADSIFYSTKVNATNNVIKDLTLRFEDTKLTTSERQIFEALKKDLNSLEDSENKFIVSEYSNPTPVYRYITSVKTHLNSLSDIQLNEGKKQVSITQKAVEGVELFTQIEIYVLILLAIIIQIIILYNPKDSI